jgi:hypothetical protein
MSEWYHALVIPIITMSWAAVLALVLLSQRQQRKRLDAMAGRLDILSRREQSHADQLGAYAILLEAFSSRVERLEEGNTDEIRQ